MSGGESTRHRILGMRIWTCKHGKDFDLTLKRIKAEAGAHLGDWFWLRLADGGSDQNGGGDGGKVQLNSGCMMVD